MIDITVKACFNETSDLLYSGGGKCFHYNLFTLLSGYLMDSPLYVMHVFLYSRLNMITTVLLTKVPLLSYNTIRNFLQHTLDYTYA